MAPNKGDQKRKRGSSSEGDEEQETAAEAVSSSFSIRSRFSQSDWANVGGVSAVVETEGEEKKPERPYRKRNVMENKDGSAGWDRPEPLKDDANDPLFGAIDELYQLIKGVPDGPGKDLSTMQILLYCRRSAKERQDKAGFYFGSRGKIRTLFRADRSPTKPTRYNPSPKTFEELGHTFFLKLTDEELEKAGLTRYQLPPVQTSGNSGFISLRTKQAVEGCKGKEVVELEDNEQLSEADDDRERDVEGLVDFETQTEIALMESKDDEFNRKHMNSIVHIEATEAVFGPIKKISSAPKKQRETVKASRILDPSVTNKECTDCLVVWYNSIDGANLKKHFENNPLVGFKPTDRHVKVLPVINNATSTGWRQFPISLRQIFSPEIDLIENLVVKGTISPCEIRMTWRDAAGQAGRFAVTNDETFTRALEYVRLKKVREFHIGFDIPAPNDENDQNPTIIDIQNPSLRSNVSLQTTADADEAGALSDGDTTIDDGEPKEDLENNNSLGFDDVEINEALQRSAREINHSNIGQSSAPPTTPEARPDLPVSWIHTYDGPNLEAYLRDHPVADLGFDQVHTRSILGHGYFDGLRFETLSRMLSEMFWAQIDLIKDHVARQRIFPTTVLLVYRDEGLGSRLMYVTNDQSLTTAIRLVISGRDSSLQVGFDLRPSTDTISKASILRIQNPSSGAGAFTHHLPIPANTEFPVRWYHEMDMISLATYIRELPVRQLKFTKVHKGTFQIQDQIHDLNWLGLSQGMVLAFNKLLINIKDVAKRNRVRPTSMRICHTDIAGITTHMMFDETTKDLSQVAEIINSGKKWEIHVGFGTVDPADSAPDVENPNPGAAVEGTGVAVPASEPSSTGQSSNALPRIQGTGVAIPIDQASTNGKDPDLQSLIEETTERSITFEIPITWVRSEDHPVMISYLAQNPLPGPLNVDRHLGTITVYGHLNGLTLATLEQGARTAFNFLLSGLRDVSLVHTFHLRLRYHLGSDLNTSTTLYVDSQDGVDEAVKIIVSEEDYNWTLEAGFNKDASISPGNGSRPGGY
ncbi:hypothetical protein VTL71DRAFT_11195 [Oculimacula yallundae]|uniref:Uncharacterized protein n=1 Tax=Oculimacula yallundae TaxID=86028 RepID=A0ABR4CVA6_9HELO